MERLTAEPLRDAIAELREENQRLRRENASLREQAQRQSARAEEEWASWQRVHDAMNLLREDAMRVLRENGVTELHAQLQEERESHQKLKAKRKRWMQFARQSVEMKALMAQRARDLEEALEEMRQRLERVEKQREETVEQAELIVQQRDLQMSRFKKWCERWIKGEVGAIEVVGAISAETQADLQVEPTLMERRKAVADMKTMARLTSEVEDWKTYEAQARGFALTLLSHFGKGGGNLSAMTQAGLYEQVIAHLKEET